MTWFLVVVGVLLTTRGALRLRNRSLRPGAQLGLGVTQVLFGTALVLAPVLPLLAGALVVATITLTVWGVVATRSSAR